MEPTRFDTLTRTLTAAPSRRGLVRAFAGLLVVAPLSGLSGRNGVEAKKRHKHKGKKCKAPKKKCGAKCVAIQSDPRNCGSCGHGCTDGEACQNGVCTPLSCPTGQHDCGAQGCRQCCANSHCGSFQHCDLTRGACVCANHTQICNDPYVCWSCCTEEHCRPYGRAPEDGFICTVQHACVCREGTTETPKPDLSGYYCTPTPPDGDSSP